MLSVIVLTHNNEDTLSRTLENLAWCDECIAIDDYSRDRTPLIAKRFGAFVYSRHLACDFAAQRNFGIGKAKGNWILFVDSDEIVTQELKKEIISVTHKEQGEVKGYYIRRTDIFFWKSAKVRRDSRSSVIKTRTERYRYMGTTSS